MNAPAPRSIETPAIGSPFEGGFFAGQVAINGNVHAIILAPKAEGRHAPTAWNQSTKTVTGALSYHDGWLNTVAMAEAGSEVAKWALARSIAGYADWYIPALDELEQVYRNLKPTTAKNWCYARAGINLNACPPTVPYTPDLPAQTTVEAFREGGAEALEAEWYWTSTQDAGVDSWAWLQDFGDGSQNDTRKDLECPVVLVRRVVIG